MIQAWYFLHFFSCKKGFCLKQAPYQNGSPAFIANLVPVSWGGGSGDTFPEAVLGSLQAKCYLLSLCVVLCALYLAAKSWLVKLAEQLE